MIVRLRDNIRRLDAVDIAIEVLEELGEFIADLNREQLIQGKLNDGSDIEPDYTETTVFLKEKFGVGKGKITDNVTLFDTGAFHKSIMADIFSDEVLMDATDSKLNELEAKYTDKILGLTDDSIKKLKEKALPLFWKKFNEQILR